MISLLFNRIAILGLGLIGGSLARALHERGPEMHIAAFDASRDALEWAGREGFIGSSHTLAAEAVRNADIIVFAVPPSAFAELAREIKATVKTGALITDVASVKRHAIAALLLHVPQDAHYVPAHPIAGSEKTGVAAGRADLFAGKCVILTPEERDVTSAPVARIRALWESVGARIDYMPAFLHDRLYAYISHLPQLIAFAARSGRLAASSPELWADICLANADVIDEALGDFLAFGVQMTGELSGHDESTSEDREAAQALFPKLLAVCLIATVASLEDNTGVSVRRYAGSGFAEMTALSGSDPQAVLLAVSHHSRSIAVLLDATLLRLENIRSAIRRAEKGQLMRILSGRD